MFTENPIVKEGIKFYFKLLKQNLKQGEKIINQNIKKEGIRYEKLDGFTLHWDES